MKEEQIEFSKEGRLHSLSHQEPRAVLVGVYRSSLEKEVAERHLDELKRLCETYGVVVVDKMVAPLRQVDAQLFLKQGKVSELKALGEQVGNDLFIFDDEILPRQQKNLEKELKKVVIDRTELILGVFEKHARSREARIQVELAKLRYQLPRLTRLWTHLERQRTGGGSGGGGYLRGAGESQIEIDRRLLKKRVDQLQQELKLVAKTRLVQKKARERSQIPTFGIVGYTNAGKSSLFNALTDAAVGVEDRLFATLDTTTRKLQLPDNQQVLLTDTVGFIRKLPHQLIAAFKSTLDEAVDTDILLHVIDASSKDALEQAATTMEVLKELKADKKPVIVVINKIDLCETRTMINQLKISYRKTVSISAATKEGLDALLQKMSDELSNIRKACTLKIPQSNYALVSEVMLKGRVVSTEYEEDCVILHAEIPLSLEHKVKPFKI